MKVMIKNEKEAVISLSKDALVDLCSMCETYNVEGCTVEEIGERVGEYQKFFYDVLESMVESETISIDEFGREIVKICLLDHVSIEKAIEMFLETNTKHLCGYNDQAFKLNSDSSLRVFTLHREKFIGMLETPKRNYPLKFNTSFMI